MADHLGEPFALPTQEEHTAALDSGQVPAATGSHLTALRARRAKLQNNLHKDLKVPRWDEQGGNEVYVRFRPLTDSELTAAQKRGTKMRGDDRGVVLNATLLANACLGIFEVVDGEEVSFDPEDRDGEWLKFDERLGELLDVAKPRAVDVVRALYFTDGDLMATAAQLAEWSGYSSEQLDREHSGN